MRLSQVRHFVAVVQAGSIGAAARDLGVSQPGITKSIRALEAELHARLLQRTNHGVVPTEQGRLFFARAQVADSELRKAEQEIGEADGARAGSVSFGVGPIVAQRLVPEAVARFRERHPQASLRIFEGLSHGLVPLVRAETLDFAVVVRLPGIRLEGAVSFRPLFENHRVVAARKGHPLANARSLAQLSEVPWVSFEPRQILEQTFTAVGQPLPRPIILCESYAAFLALISSSDMLSIVPRLVLAAPGGQALQEIRIAEKIPSFTVGLFTRADAPLTPIAAAMARAISSVARRQAASR